jgi:hypothetical protein
MEEKRKPKKPESIYGGFSAMIYEYEPFEGEKNDKFFVKGF